MSRRRRRRNRPVTSHEPYRLVGEIPAALPEPKALNGASKALLIRAKQDYEANLQAICQQALGIDKPGEGYIVDIERFVYFVPPKKL